MPILLGSDDSSSEYSFSIKHGRTRINARLVLLTSLLSVSYCYYQFGIPISTPLSSYSTYYGLRNQPLELPTIAIADMDLLNAELLRAATACQIGAQPHRQTTKTPYGWASGQHEDYPYIVTETDQFSLDDILTTKLMTYSKLISLAPSETESPSPDFIFLPWLPQLYTIPWGCNVESERANQEAAVNQVTSFIRAIAASLPSTSPRLILPISTPRSDFDKNLLHPTLSKEFEDKIILVGIEGAPRYFQERMKWVIDLPYPTRTHLLEQDFEGKELNLIEGGVSRTEIGDAFIKNERPYLLVASLGVTHPWGAPQTDRFNGFALRAAIRTELEENGNSARILFNSISDSIDGSQNLTKFSEDMERSIFSLQPAGDTPTRRGFYDSLLMGSIPVIFRKTSYYRLFPSNPLFNSDLFTVYIDEVDLIEDGGKKRTLINFLESIPAAEIKRKQEHIKKIAQMLQYSYPSTERSLPLTSPVTDSRPAEEVFAADAFGQFLRELATIKVGKFKAREGIIDARGRRKHS